MNVVLAAGGGAVAQLFCDPRDGLGDAGFFIFAAAMRAHGDQLTKRENRSDPSTKILGGEILAGNFAEVAIHIARIYIARAAIGSEILKQTVAGKLVAAADDTCDFVILEPDGMMNAALSIELETKHAALGTQVAVAQSGETEGMICPRIFAVADADCRGFEEAHDGGQNLFAGELGALQVAGNPGADF